MHKEADSTTQKNGVMISVHYNSKNLLGNPRQDYEGGVLTN